MSRKQALWPPVVKVFLDAVLIQVAFFLAYVVRYQLQWFRPVDEAYRVPYGVYFPAALLLTAILILLYWGEGIYGRRRKYSMLYDSYVIFRGSVTSIAALYVLSLVYRPVLYSRLIFAYAGAIVTVLLIAMRGMEQMVVANMRRHGRGVQRVLIIGAGEVGRTIMRNIAAQPQLGYQVVGFLDDDPARGNTDIGRFRALGGLDHIPEALGQNHVDEVIITLPWLYHSRIQGIVSQCERTNTPVKIVPDVFQLSLNHVDIDYLNGIPLIGFKSVSIKGWNLAVKRAIDVFLASVGLIVLSPLLLLIALAIKVESPGPVIFRQTRIGKGGRPFTVLKFRSMRQSAEVERNALLNQNEASGPLFKIKDDPRRTRVGRLIRRFSLDELPQLYNILRGEMSLIGPRPPLPAEVEQYQDWHKKRLETWPGLTGLWQVSGRSDLTFDEMVLLDIYYVENWSLLLDLQITLRTVPTVILGTGAY